MSFWSEKNSNGTTLATWSFLDEKVCTSVGNLPSRNAFEKSEDFGKTERGKGLKHIVRAEGSGITLRHVIS